MNKQERNDLKELESHFDRLEHLQLSVKARAVIGSIRQGLVLMYSVICRGSSCAILSPITGALS